MLGRNRMRFSFAARKVNTMLSLSKVFEVWMKWQRNCGTPNRGASICSHTSVGVCRGGGESWLFPPCFFLFFIVQHFFFAFICFPSHWSFFPAVLRIRCFAKLTSIILFLVHFSTPIFGGPPDPPPTGGGDAPWVDPGPTLRILKESLIQTQRRSRSRTVYMPYYLLGFPLDFRDDIFNPCPNSISPPQNF